VDRKILTERLRNKEDSGFWLNRLERRNIARGGLRR
jgi:hypothetical protein